MKAAAGGSSRSSASSGSMLRSRRSRRSSWLLPAVAFVSATSTLPHVTQGLRLDEEVEADLKSASKERERLKELLSSRIDALVDSLSPGDGDDLDKVEATLKKALGNVVVVKEEESEIQDHIEAHYNRQEAEKLSDAEAIARKTGAHAASVACSKVSKAAAEAEAKAENKATDAEKAKGVAEQLTARAEDEAKKSEAARAYAVEREKVAVQRLIPYKAAEDKAEKFASQLQLKANAAEDKAEAAERETEDVKQANAEAIAKHQILLKELAQSKEAEARALERAHQAEGRLKEIQVLELEVLKLKGTLQATTTALEKCHGDMNAEVKSSTDFKQSLVETQGKISFAERAQAESERRVVELVNDAGRSDSFRHLAQKDLGICRDQEQEMRYQRDDARRDMFVAKKAQIDIQHRLTEEILARTRVEEQVKQAKAAGCLLRAKGEACSQFHGGRDCASANCLCDHHTELQCTCG